jgi:glycosyltransferase involved in cell wall biosynthesis
MHLPHLVMVGLTGLAWLLALGWLGRAVASLRGMPTLPDLTRIDPSTLPELPHDGVPHLTVIVPACNEHETIEATLRSLLASTQIRLEIIAINDRSTDTTGELMDKIAVDSAFPTSHALRILHNHELPQGWLGKPHALELGVRQASAPWILLTDADVLFAPRALELALRLAIATNADHLVLPPMAVRGGLGGAAMRAILPALAGWNVRFWKVSDPKARDFLGVGGFNMVRTETLRSQGCFECLRMEVVEDLSLGWLVKKAGYRSTVALGPGLVTICWIQGWFGIIRNAEKNGFAIFRYRPIIAALAIFGLLIQILLPLAAIAAGGWAAMAGLLVYASIAAVIFSNRRLTAASPLFALLFAPSVVIIAFALLRSAVLTLSRGGVMWRGTLYPLAELKRHAQSWRP